MDHVLHPFICVFQQVARVVSWTQGCFALGNMLGPAVGAALYSIGGFMLPFFIIGGLNTAFSIALIASIPNLKSIDMNGNSNNNENDKISVKKDSEHDVQDDQADKESGGLKPNLGLVNYKIHNITIY